MAKIRKIAVTSLDHQIAEIVDKTEKKILAIWAADCAERTLHYFEEEYPEDNRPRKAIETLRTWIGTGEFHMEVIRKASLDSHAAARMAEDFSAAQAAARACGQAVATAHAARHSIAAALYAVTAIRNATNSIDKINKERDWQYQRLLDLKFRSSETVRN